jgi:16S rRNA (guanine527-N7)-methyltransferase
VQATLKQGLTDLGLSAVPELESNLLQYLALLQRWNKAYNLTSIRDPEQMVIRHILDSLALAPLFSALPGTSIDVGTGAGLPGIPLALVFPEREFCLLDSNGKKTRFLFQVKTELGLANMSVRNDRVEALETEEKFDLILSRAFSNLQQMVSGCRHLLADNGRYLAMKGVYPTAEIADLPADVEVVAVHALQVPGLKEERHLVEIKSKEGK